MIVLIRNNWWCFGDNETISSTFMYHMTKAFRFVPVTVGGQETLVLNNILNDSNGKPKIDFETLFLVRKVQLHLEKSREV